MAEMTHEEIERIWNSFSHYIPERTKLDGAVDFISTLRDIGVEDKEIKGEITIIIGGSDKLETNGYDEVNLKRELHLLVKAGLSLSSASKYLAKKENITKSIIYNLY